MTSSIRLRVAVTDSSSAIGMVTTCIHRATGMVAQPEYQELDRHDLILELSVQSVDSAHPSGLARIVERHSDGFELLSSWRELEDGTEIGRRQPNEVCRADIQLPHCAARAVRDHLPTSQWLAGLDGHPPHWELAVPCPEHDDRIIAAITRRNGYSQRFSALDARALHRQMTSARAA